MDNLEEKYNKLLNEYNELKEKQAVIEYEFDLFNKYTITSETDTKGIITYVSEPFIEISGYSKEELIGQPHNIVRHPDMPSEVFKEIWDTIKSKKVWQGNVKNKRKDGKLYWVKSIIFPILDHNNDIIGYKSIRLDISDTKKLEDMVNKVLFSQPKGRI